MPFQESDVLPAPGQLLAGSDMRVQEIIHGHRFMQEQEPYMIVLEALAVMRAKAPGKILPGAAAHESFSYDLYHRRKMRFLLFQDRHLDRVAKDSSIHDQDKWKTWKERANDQFDPNRNGQDHFSYLDQVFQKRIDSLHQAVRLLRSMEVDVMHNRRWTSRFLSVTGPDMICPDMREGPQQRWSTDRRFFGRGGELVWLMINRSARASEVGDLVRKRLLNRDDPMNRIALSLTDPDERDQASSAQIGYLPYRSLPAYDRMAEDWASVLRLDGLPSGHLFEPLFRITGLNIVRYLAERAQAETGSQSAEPIVADLMDGSDKQLRDLSKEHVNRHRQVANRAVAAHVNARLDANPDWKAALKHADAAAAALCLRKEFAYHVDSGPGARTPTALRDELIEDARNRDKNNTHRYLLPLTKGIGLATGRQRVGAWFAVDDAMVFALVMANVDRTVELRDFVATLHDRYGLVIGPEEARRAFDRLPVAVQSFEANLAALEARMTRLGLTRRLSDDCAFVTNPFRQNNG